MEAVSLAEFLAHWNVTGRMVKVTTPYTGDEQTEHYRRGVFELMLDGAVYKGEASWPVENKEPSILQVFNDMRSMALACDNAESFEKWAEDLGYDQDSREAEARYNNRCYEVRRFERWLGIGRYRMLLWETKGL